jgi:stage III sporulation protein AG
MLKKAFEKLKGSMNNEKSVRLIVLGGVAGLICILLSSWIPDSEKQTDEPLTQTIDNAGLPEESQRYSGMLEERLEEMLSQIDGVGSCRVMVTVSGSVSYSYAQNAEQQLSENSREVKRQHVILDEKTGDSALIECAKNPEVIGVIIACEGGEHNVIREEIISAVGAVLDIPSNRICVTKKISESGD